MNLIRIKNYSYLFLLFSFIFLSCDEFERETRSGDTATQTQDSVTSSHDGSTDPNATDGFIPGGDTDIGQQNPQNPQNPGTDTTTGTSEGGDDTSDTGTGPAAPDIDPPPPISGGHDGYATRYWDCCMAHCSWTEHASNPLRVCDVNNNPLSRGGNITSGCGGGNAYTCFDMSPWAVGPRLAYGFVATAGHENVNCGDCFQLDFDGGARYGDPRDTHRALSGKTMIVQATNIGYDVGSGHFDIMIPGGGVGAFQDGCPRQWNTSDQNLLGETYGGFLTTCQHRLGWEASSSQLKSCVRSMCDALFTSSSMSDLLAGCHWFVDWFEAADNPTFKYQQVDCPTELRAKGM